jgi:Tfp pilus assembly protein PilV
LKRQLILAILFSERYPQTSNQPQEWNMKHQKGFSLIDVLVSLFMLTTLILSLLQQQWQSRQLLHQLILTEQKAQLLDGIHETPQPTIWPKQ